MVVLAGHDVVLDQDLIDLLRTEAPQVLGEYQTQFEQVQNSRQNYYNLRISSNTVPHTQQNPAPIPYGGEKDPQHAQASMQQAYMQMSSSAVLPAQQGPATIHYGPQQDPKDGMHQNTLAALPPPTEYPTQHSQHPSAPSNQFPPGI